MTRTEIDSLGPVQVPSERLWGAQTERALVHFSISTETLPDALIQSLASVKRACAEVNQALGRLDAPRAEAIIAAAEEVLAGRHAQEFPL